MYKIIYCIILYVYIYIYVYIIIYIYEYVISATKYVIQGRNLPILIISNSQSGEKSQHSRMSKGKAETRGLKLETVRRCRAEFV